MFGLEVKGADGRAGHLRQLDGTHLGLIDGAERSVGGEDGGAAGFDDVGQAEQPLARAAAAGTAHGIEAKDFENAGNQLAVEALADEDHGAGVAEVDRAGQYALVPEAVDVGRGLLARDGGGDAFRGEDLETPGKAGEPDQRRDDARDDGQDQALDEGEAGMGFGGHCIDFSC